MTTESNHKMKDKDLANFEWRTGTKKSVKAKQVYAQIGKKPSKDDILIGEMKSPMLAQEMVADHNSWLDD